MWDVMIGNEEDFTACLGLEVEGTDENLSHLDGGKLQANDCWAGSAISEYPGCGYDSPDCENRQRLMTGERFRGMMALSLSQSIARILRFWTGLAAAIVLLRV